MLKYNNPIQGCLILDKDEEEYFAIGLLHVQGITQKRLGNMESYSKMHVNLIEKLTCTASGADHDYFSLKTDHS